MANLWQSEALPVGLRWAAGSPPPAPTWAPQQGSVPAVGGMPGDPGTPPGQIPNAPWTGGLLIPGQKITSYVPLPNGGVMAPELWNGMDYGTQVLVRDHGWPLPVSVVRDSATAALLMAQEQAQLEALQRQNQAEAQAQALQRQMIEDPWGAAAATLGANGAATLQQNPQLATNLMLLQQGRNPQIAYWDPVQEQANADRDYNARLMGIAQALAANATDADMAAWQQRTQWGLPNEGALYSLQQPGGMIDSIFRQQGWAYNPTPAQHLPAPSLWGNWARAQQEVR